ASSVAASGAPAGGEVSPSSALETNADRFGTDVYEIAAPAGDFDAMAGGFGALLSVLRARAGVSIAATGEFRPLPDCEVFKPPANGAISYASVTDSYAGVPNPSVAAPSAGAADAPATAVGDRLSEFLCLG